MPQRYYPTDPKAGCNFYQSYLATGGYPTVPSALAEIGIAPGLKVNGASGTTWQFVNMGTASPVVTAGTAVPINASTFVVQSGTSTLNGTALVGMTASVPGGLWMEVSGATLNLTPLTMSVEEAEAGVADAKAAETRAQAALKEAKEAHAAEAKAEVRAQAATHTNATTKAHS